MSDIESNITLSSFHFFKGTRPDKLILHHNGLETHPQVANSITGVWGKKATHQAILGARDYAQARNMDYLLIDFLVKVRTPASNFSKETIKPELVADTSFLWVRQFNKDLVSSIQSEYGLTSDDKSHYIRNQHLQHDIALSIMPTAELEHVNLFIYPNQTILTDEMLNTGTVPYSHWDSIVSATSRFDCDVKIDLQSPVQMSDDDTMNQKQDHQDTSKPFAVPSFAD